MLKISGMEGFGGLMKGSKDKPFMDKSVNDKKLRRIMEDMEGFSGKKYSMYRWFSP